MSRDSKLKSLALLVVSLLVAFGAAEVGLRLGGVKFDASLYGNDAVTGWRLRPHAQGWWTTENVSYVRLNSFGGHDREYSLAKPPNTVRVAVLGDSMTAAVQVEIPQTFASVLQQRLAGCPAFGQQNVEVMNFGVPGFGTAQELLQFRHYVRPYDPDIVILAFFTYNDVHNNHRALNPVAADSAPYFVLRDNQLVLDDSFRRRGSSYGWLRDRLADAVNRSRVAQLVAEGLIRHGLFRLTRPREEAIQERFGGDMGTLMHAAPKTPEMQEAWQVTEGVILQLAREVEQAGARFWLVTLLEGTQGLPPAERAREVERRRIEDLYYSDRRLERFATSHGLRVLNLADQVAALPAHPGKPLTFGNGSGHYTPEGHLLIGTLIAGRICSPSAGSRDSR